MTIRLDETTGQVIAVVAGGKEELLLEGRAGRLRAPVAQETTPIMDKKVKIDGHPSPVGKCLPSPRPLEQVKARPYAVAVGGHIQFYSQNMFGERVRALLEHGVPPQAIAVVDERDGAVYPVTVL
jgi:hypothetical protein